MCPEDERQSQPTGCGSSARLGVTLTCGDLDNSHEASKTIWTSTGLNKTPQVEIHCPCNPSHSGDSDKGFGSFVKRLMDAEAAIVSAAAQLVSFKDILKDTKSNAVNRQRVAKQRGLLLQKMEDFRQLNQVVRQKLNQLLDEEADRIDASTKIDALLNKILQIERENQLLKGDLGVTEKRAEELMYLQKKEQENIKSALNIAKSAESTRARIQGQLRNKEAENNRLTVQLRTLERSLAQHKAELEDLKASLAALTEQTSQEKEAFKKASRVHKQKAERLEAALDKCFSQLRDKDAQLSNLQEKKDSWKREREQLTEENHKLTAHVELLQKQVIGIPMKLQKDMEREKERERMKEKEDRVRERERMDWEARKKDWEEKVKEREKELEARGKERKVQEDKEQVRGREEREKERREWEDMEKERLKGKAEREKERRDWEREFEEREKKRARERGAREREGRGPEKAREDSSEREERQERSAEEADETSAALDSLTQELERLRAEKEHDGASHAALKLSFAQLEKKLAECEAALVQEKSASSAKDGKVVQFENQVAALEAELRKVRLQCQNVSQELVKMQDGEESKANELQTQVKLVRSAVELREAAEESGSKFQEQVDAQQKMLEKLRQEKLELERKLEVQETALRHSSQQLEQRSTRCAALERQLDQSTCESQTLNKQLAQCSVELLDFKQQVKNVKEQVLSKEEALQTTVNELRLLRQGKLSAEKHLEARVKELQLSLDKCESHKKSIQNYVDFLKNSYLMIFEDQISTFWSSTFMK
ncbi:golgin subfamily A member 6-like protein 26 isoform X2 [Syngnathoides biaculeatus]|uniref:golgin subfamily A member 6-like protein 26 isoform X2 n=1 Tax=Syngnathoides biaculeatus TaxID=300417 RepID=UPI002ADE89F4|nr:golgin subfamily A member 6-like protein 26 isoform X2 [Syngnathoides biaculeatus]